MKKDKSQIKRTTGDFRPQTYSLKKTKSNSGLMTGVALSIIFLVGFLIYSNSFDCSFHLDDRNSIIENLNILIKGGDEMVPMIPWYKGFKGTIVKESETDNGSTKFITTGVWKRLDNTSVQVTELPIGKWTQTYKEFLDSLVEENEIIDYKNNSDDMKVEFKIIMQKNVIDELINKELMVKKLKLTSSISTSNMHVFDSECKIRKVTSPEEIIYRFYILIFWYCIW